MRDFSWKYFSNTGSIESYLLYKECIQCAHGDEVEEEQEETLELSPF